MVASGVASHAENLFGSARERASHDFFRMDVHVVAGTVREFRELETAPARTVRAFVGAPAWAGTRATAAGIEPCDALRW